MTGRASRDKGARADFGKPKTHGHSVRYQETPTYRSWRMMRTRCQNPNYDGFHDYGGRGITVCPEWNAFEGFLADMGERPEGTTLDRIDVDGNYEPGNCRWATVSEQNRNMRHGRYELFGELQTIRTAYERHAPPGLPWGSVRRRIQRLKWDVEDAISTPPRPIGRPWKGTEYAHRQ